MWTLKGPVVLSPGDVWLSISDISHCQTACFKSLMCKGNICLQFCFLHRLNMHNHILLHRYHLLCKAILYWSSILYYLLCESKVRQCWLNIFLCPTPSPKAGKCRLCFEWRRISQQYSVVCANCFGTIRTRSLT